MDDRITPDFLREHFLYDPSSGLVTWRTGLRAGKRAGSRRNNGSRYVSLFGQQIAEHRIIFLIVMGSYPPIIDHRNLDRGDNRWDNLRPATPAQNNANCRARHSGLKGAYRKGRSWGAAIKIDKKQVWLGRFKSEQAAHEAYCRAAIAAYGEFARAE